MFNKVNIIELLLAPFKLLLSVDSNSSNNINTPQRIIIICSHYELGIIFSSSLLFRSIKRKYNNTNIVLLVKEDYKKILKNSVIIELLGLDKNDKIISGNDAIKYFALKFDVAIVPTYEKFSALSHFIMRLSRSTSRIGISKLFSKTNPYSFLFDQKIEIVGNSPQDTQITELIEELLKPCGIYKSFHGFELKNYEISNSEKRKIYKKVGIIENQKIILLNNVPEDIQNKWSVENLVKLISLLVKSGEYFFCYIEDEIEPDIKNMLETDIEFLHYLKKDNFEELLNIFSICDLVVTCDSNIMHFAGLINVPQISIFGLSNPFSLAPIGPNKKFIKNSDLINDITGEDVYALSQSLLNKY